MQDYTYTVAPVTDEERLAYPVLGRLANLADVASGRATLAEPAFVRQARANGWIVKS